MRPLPLPAVLGLLGLALLCASPPPASGEGLAGQGVVVKTPRGAALAATLHRPKAPNGAAVVLAPGQGYHRGLPLLVRSAEALADAGFVALRFDWAYFTAKGAPSEGLAMEIEDLDAAVAHVRAIEGVSKVILAGKSLGSLVALARAAKGKDEFAGVALLTFPIHEPGSPARLRDGVEALTSLATPALVVSGDRDPLCGLAALYDLCARAKAPPSVVVAPGDHSLVGPSKAEAETAENVDLAVRALVVWARRRTGA